MNATDLRIRWMIKSDIDAVLRIERLQFAQPWTRSQIEAMRKCKNVIPYVAEVGSRIVGYHFYSFESSLGIVMRIAVEPASRRRGIGTALVNRGLRSCTESGRKLAVTVPEDAGAMHDLLCSIAHETWDLEVIHGASETRFIFDHRLGGM